MAPATLHPLLQCLLHKLRTVDPALAWLARQAQHPDQRHAVGGGNVGATDRAVQGGVAARGHDRVHVAYGDGESALGGRRPDDVDHLAVARQRDRNADDLDLGRQRRAGDRLVKGGELNHVQDSTARSRCTNPLRDARGSGKPLRVAWCPASASLAWASPRRPCQQCSFGLHYRTIQCRIIGIRMMRSACCSPSASISLWTNHLAVDD